MPSRPSIKGILLAGVVADLRALVACGRLSREELRRRLEAEDLELLEEEVVPAFWYALGPYTRMLELLAAVEGGSDAPAYLRGRGEKAAQRLIETGLYRQLDASAEEWGESVGHILVTVGGACFNFGRWSFEAGERELRIVAEAVAPLPEVSRLAIEGFVAAITERAFGQRLAVKSRRPEPDRIVYEVERPR